MRQMKGQKELWIPVYELEDYMEVNIFEGKVRNKKTKRVYRPCRKFTKNGYPQLETIKTHIKGKKIDKSVGRIVVESILKKPIPKGKKVMHIDNEPFNNSYTNLKIVDVNFKRNLNHCTPVIHLKGGEFYKKYHSIRELDRQLGRKLGFNKMTLIDSNYYLKILDNEFMTEEVYEERIRKGLI